MKRTSALCAAFVTALVVASSALAHAKIAPPIVQKATDYVFTVAVPTESETASTTMVELTPPEGFTIDAVTPTPGWEVEVERSGSGEEAVITKITWSGGSIPPEQATNFAIVGEAESAEDYAFDVRQTYSDGEVADWIGPEDSDTPAPVVEAKESLGGGGHLDRDVDRRGARGGRARARTRRAGEPGREARAGVRRIALVAAVVGAALALPTAAWAHAVLLRTNPVGNKVLPGPPPQVTMTYSEPVEPRFAIVSVTDADGDLVTDGAPTRSPQDPNTLVVPLKRVPQGWYLVYWRVISADGHPVRGAWTFAVGPNTGPPPQFVIPSISERRRRRRSCSCAGSSSCRSWRRSACSCSGC